MKYRVVGWTFYEDQEVLDSGNRIGFAERNAIIDEIKKNKYLFSGWHHQESWDGVVPILNDGKKRCFSQRGWGGVMAEAYGYMGDYDYASFTFYQSIDSSKLKFAPDDFDIETFTPEAVMNEDFIVEVNQGLFNIAKTSNPFYLEDLDSLRYIDSNDTVTLKCGDESLYFVVKDIDRNKTELNFNNKDSLIKGKYKIIVTHKPECEREFSKVPLFSSKTQALSLFNEALTDYNYEVIKEVTETFYIEYLTEELDKKAVVKLLKKFIREYVEDKFNSSNVLRILDYINSFSLFEEIAYKTLIKTSYIFTSFIEYGEGKKKNMDNHILNVISNMKCKNSLFSGNIKLLYKAVTLKPEDKTLRKLYYKAIKNTRHEGLPIMAGADLYKYLRKDDKKYIELDNYKSFSSSVIFNIVEYLTYPNNVVFSKEYPYSLSKIYEDDDKLIEDGIKAYQNYINEHFNVDSFILDMILVGIDKRCFEMDRYYEGEIYAARYVVALDMLTNYKYKLKEKALEKYGKIYSDFEKAFDDI